MEKVSITTQNTMGLINEILFLIVKHRHNGRSMSKRQKNGLINRVVNEKTCSITRERVEMETFL